MGLGFRVLCSKLGLLGISGLGLLGFRVSGFGASRV